MKLSLARSQVRSWRETDAPSLSRHANSRRVWINLRDRFPHPYTLADGRAFIRDALARSPETMFAITIGDEAVGGIGFTLHEDVERVSAEIGYWLGESFWDRGIMTEALAAVTAHAIRSHGLSRVFAVPYEWNAASFRVLEKAGYVCEGRMRRSAIKDGRIVDQLLYACTVPTVTRSVELYDGHYGRLGADPLVAVRRETYDEDLGQASWITLAEAGEFFRALELGPGQTALEVACGSGGVTCRMALDTGATCIGIDINANGIEAAERRAREQGLESRVSFRVADAGRRLPFPDESFEAIFCNDSINHLPGRPEVLRDWHRVLRPGGRLLFTDATVVTGLLTNEEIRARSSIGYFVFTPAGLNERLLTESGFIVQEVRDATEAVVSVSGRWREARAKRREALVTLEGGEEFEGVQRFLDAVHLLASERRLSRYVYLASRPRGRPQEGT